MTPIAERIRSLIASLDRICSACMAATSQETWDLLHRDRWCRTLGPRVGDRVAWFDIGPMRRREGVVVKVVSNTLLLVQESDRPDPTTAFVCDLETP